jgi:membrane-bound ClpP family serine protease
MATFTGQEIRTWRWFVHLVPDRELLARSLKLDGEIKEKSAFDGPRVAMRSHLKGIVNPRQVNRIIRAIDESLSEGANLILLELDSPGGNIEESMLLAQHLANIPSKQAEVVVLVTGHARGDAALVALAADNLYMTRDAMLGGVGEASINPAECEKRKGAILGLAKSAALSPGDLVGCMCPDATVFEYTAADGRKQRNVAGWIDDDPKLPLWTQGGEISYRGGLSFERAQLLGLAVDSEPSLEAVGIVYGIDQLPAEKQTNTTEQIVEWIASHRWLSMLLFIIGIVCLSAELNTPGVGVPGAIAAVCFLLFFWINMFQGTVEWLEILLIAGGVVCLGIELFLLPGFGVFGVCGIGMLAVGLILAGQTFVLPTNEYQWEQVISGSGQLGFGVFVLLGLAIAFRKQLANLPMVRWFALQPSQDTGLEEIAQTNQELRGLIGRYGTTLTRCNPYGKASIGDESIDVASRDEWIDEDTDIEVIDVEGTSLIVRRRVS